MLLLGGVAQLVVRLTQGPEVQYPGSIPGQATYFLFLLPLIQEGQLSVTGESMCRKYWLAFLEIFGGLLFPL